MAGRGGCAWQRGMPGGGGVHGRGACMAGVAGGVHGRGDMRGRRDCHCRGQYASYWNAFLLHGRLCPVFITQSDV